AGAAIVSSKGVRPSVQSARSSAPIGRATWEVYLTFTHRGPGCGGIDNAAGGGRLLRFGVNYTPRRRWFHAWLDFDPDEVREDLTQIAALGLDHIRVFHLWPLLQPNRAVIREPAVEQLLALVDVAADCGLDVVVD